MKNIKIINIIILHLLIKIIFFKFFNQYVIAFTAFKLNQFCGIEYYQQPSINGAKKEKHYTKAKKLKSELYRRGAVIRNPYGGSKWHLYHPQALTHFRLITFSVKGKRALPQPQYYYFCLLLQHYIHTPFFYFHLLSLGVLLQPLMRQTHIASSHQSWNYLAVQSLTPL